MSQKTIQCKRLCKKKFFLLKTVVQDAFSRGLHIPGGAVELGGPTTSRALKNKISILMGLSQWLCRYFGLLRVLAAPWQLELMNLHYVVI